MPRFHLTWGTGPEVVRVFAEPVLEAEKRGLVTFLFRHQVDDLVVEDGVTVGVRGTVLEPSDAERGFASSRVPAGEFELRAKAVVVTSGGIGGNHELVRRNWPADRLGPAPESMITGVPAHVDGRMLEITEGAGGNIVNRDRMWHYVEGINNWDPIWPDHAIRIIPGPSSHVVRRDRAPAARPVLPRLRHPAHAARDPQLPVTTTRGSCSTRRSSRRSSRCPGPSRTPTSPARTSS